MRGQKGQGKRIDCNLEGGSAGEDCKGRGLILDRAFMRLWLAMCASNLRKMTLQEDDEDFK